jgi:hypothetical protein
LWKKGYEDNKLSHIAMKAEFFEFMETHCNMLKSSYKIEENKYFDEEVYSETMKVIENYYKLDTSIEMLLEKKNKAKL